MLCFVMTFISELREVLSCVFLLHFFCQKLIIVKRKPSWHSHYVGGKDFMISYYRLKIWPPITVYAIISNSLTSLRRGNIVLVFPNVCFWVFGCLQLTFPEKPGIRKITYIHTYNIIRKIGLQLVASEHRFCPLVATNIS